MKANLKQALKAHIRWMIRRDMPEVLAVEGESFEFPWCEEDFLRCLRQRNCIGMVAEQHRQGSTQVLNPGALYRANPHTIAIVDLPSLAITRIKV